uniref:Uncharacterized protein n=1 Tax=Rubinisphaera brasiliensis (strain ATCC 49424 / DSM 5305 / JCM 21570 / IAM 15109 / NBRC 103401 / IFAM 1448) TaxID=756272 RepID=F0SGX8_RUBBR|nr:hypothetical protein Plabr_1853 [Rubinisphaera brasiliensis DSM 5305]
MRRRKINPVGERSWRSSAASPGDMFACWTTQVDLLVGCVAMHLSAKTTCVCRSFRSSHCWTSQAVAPRRQTPHCWARPHCHLVGQGGQGRVGPDFRVRATQSQEACLVLAAAGCPRHPETIGTWNSKRNGSRRSSFPWLRRVHRNVRNILELPTLQWVALSGLPSSGSKIEVALLDKPGSGTLMTNTTLPDKPDSGTQSWVCTRPTQVDLLVGCVATHLSAKSACVCRSLSPSHCWTSQAVSPKWKGHIATPCRPITRLTVFSPAAGLLRLRTEKDEPAEC